MKNLILGTSLFFAAACNSPTKPPAQEAWTTPQQLHNNITEAEIIEGWELMFDGQHTGNFRKYGDTVIGKAWVIDDEALHLDACLLYTSPSPRDGLLSRMPSSA